MEINHVKRIMPSGYQYVDLTARDVSACSKNFRELELESEVKGFAFPPNYVQRDRLLSLFGTIPVEIRGNTYNIPICIYLRKDHPYYPPYCYVTPTAGMSLCPSQYMDTKGMVYLPYLNEWKQDKSHLSDLVQILIVTFGEQCPVYMYSTPRGGAAAHQPRPQWNQPTTAYPQQLHPPYPVAGDYQAHQPLYEGYPISQPNTAPYPTSDHPESYAMSTATPSSYPPQRQYLTPYPMPPASTATYPAVSSSPTPYSSQPPSTFTPAVATAATTAAVSTVASNAEKERQDESIKKESLITEKEMDSLLNTLEKLRQRNTDVTGILSQIQDKKAVQHQVVTLKDDVVEECLHVEKKANATQKERWIPVEKTYKAPEKDKTVKKMDDDKQELVAQTEAAMKEAENVRQALQRENQQKVEQLNVQQFDVT